MIYVILGMHKSGTTLLAQMLHLSGINMVDKSMASESVYERLLAKPDDGNFRERVNDQTNYFFERKSVNQLNQNILIQSGAKKTQNGYVSAFYLPKKSSLKLSSDLQDEMEQIITTCNQKYPEWGFKDPRTCLTYDLWAKVLPASHKIIVVYRSFKEILRSYKVFGWRQVYFPRLWKVLRSWMYHNRCILDYLNNTTYPYVVINYEALMTDANELERLHNFVGRPLIDSRNKNLYRSRAKRKDLALFERLIAFGLGDNPLEIMAQYDSLRING